MNRFIITLLMGLTLLATDAYADANKFSHNYHLSVAGDNNPASDFDINLQFEWVDGAMRISVPLINFNVVNSNGGLVTTIKPKRLSDELSQRLFGNRRELTFAVAIDDAYITGFSFDDALPTPLNNLVLRLTPKGELTITGPSNTSIPTGAHCVVSTTLDGANCDHRRERGSDPFEFQLFMQMVDSAGFPYPDQPPFPINVTGELLNDSSWAKIEIPAFTFQTFVAQYPNPGLPDYVPTGLTGGFVNTGYNALPEDFHPALDQGKLIGGGNSGLQNLVLAMNRYGQLAIYGSGSQIQVIPPGTILVEPTTLYYKVYDQAELEEFIPQNFIIQPAFSNMTQFTNPIALEDAFLEFHINDQWSNLAAWSWTDNSAQTDKVTTNLSDAYVCLADLNPNRSSTSNESTTPPLQLRTPLNLSNNVPNVQVRNTAVAINRVNPNYVVASWIQRDLNVDSGNPLVAVSSDGGYSFGTPFNIDPTYFAPGIRVESMCGAVADKFGNFWIALVDENLNGANVTNNVRIYVSSDFGNSWLIGGAPLFQTFDSTQTSGTGYSWSQMTLGNDGAGNYGAFWVSEYFQNNEIDVISYIGFVPTTGLGLFPSATNLALAPYASLPDTFLDITTTPSIAVNQQGEAFIAGWWYPFYNYAPNTFGYKPAGALVDTVQQILGPYVQYNNFNNTITEPVTFPGFPYFEGPYFPICPRVIFYDERRHCVLSISNENDQFDGENYNLYMQISFNKGRSWSRRFYLASTRLQNRGQNTAYLNPETHDLFIGFYDARNVDINPPPNAAPYSSVQYYGAYMSQQQLDKLVNKLRREMGKNHR